MAASSRNAYNPLYSAIAAKLGSIGTSFVFGTFLLWSGQGGPEEAWSNWQKWLKFFGIETVPAWLSSQAFLSWVSAAGGAFVGAALVLLYTTWRRQNDLSSHGT